MSEVLDALERVVAAVKRHVDNGDAPQQILHTVAGIRNEYRDRKPGILRGVIPAIYTTSSGPDVKVAITEKPGATVTPASQPKVEASGAQPVDENGEPILPPDGKPEPEQTPEPEQSKPVRKPRVKKPEGSGSN